MASDIVDQDILPAADDVPKAKPEPRKYTILYSMVFILAYWHVGGLYGVYLCFTSIKWPTLLLNIVYYVLGGWGVTAGAHRLWSHRAYKAKLPLQILLMLCQSLACQATVYVWVRDHRLHHRYCDTDADPYNSTRGFFFSHIGWLMVKKHPDVLKRGKELDMSDLLENPVLQFQRKHYVKLLILLTLVQPVVIPWYFWGESMSNAHFVHLSAILLGNHITYCINSVAHMFGSKPYDKNISPTQSAPLSLFAFGEGYHNYHHVFPFDYRVAELGNNSINFSTKFIDFFARLGWAYDLKYATDDMILKRTNRTGDGTDLWGKSVKQTFVGE